MLGEFLHGFFFAMPAVVVVTYGLQCRARSARVMLVWGGGLFAVLMGLAVLGMLACDGRSLTGYSACFGGAPVDALFGALSPLLRVATYAYILAGPPLVGLALLLDWMHTRGSRTA